MLIKHFFSLFLLLIFDTGPFFGKNFITFVIGIRRLHKTFMAPNDFQFTALQYNLSIYENAAIGTIAVADQSSFHQRHHLFIKSSVPRWRNDVFRDGSEKVGAFLPKGYHQINFKIVEVNFICD